MTAYYGDAGIDRYIRGENATYSDARLTSTSEFDGSVLVVGQKLDGNFLCYRSPLGFNTSAINDAHNVTSALLTLTCTGDYSDVDFDLLVALLSTVTGTRETDYDHMLAQAGTSVTWRNTSGIATNTPYSIALPVSWINKTGYTYLGLISEEDYNASAPSGNEHIYLAPQSHPTADYRPRLDIETEPIAVVSMHQRRLQGAA